MKNLLIADLKALAEKIATSTDDVSLSELQHSAKELYEKLTVLKFIETNLTTVNDMDERKAVTPTPEPLVEPSTPETTETKRELEEIEILSTLDENLFVSDEQIYVEPATEKMIDIVAQMPQETQQVDRLIKTITTPVEISKNDKEVVSPTQKDINETPKNNSLNDRLKKGITIGLNDRIAFVKHLFNGSTEDFNRVISQLNTLTSELEALEFLNAMVKPEYNNWEGKETYEERFISFIEGKY